MTWAVEPAELWILSEHLEPARGVRSELIPSIFPLLAPDKP